MRQLRLLVFFPLWLIMVSGCSFLPYRESAPDLKLLSLVDAPADYLYRQQVVMEGAGAEKKFIAVTRLKDQQLTMIVLLPNGQKLLSLNYDGVALSEQSISGLDIPSKDILAIMQFALWPVSQVAKSYPASLGWDVESLVTQRSLMHRGSPVLDVRYRDQELFINNQRSDYRVTIRNLK